MQAIVQDTYGSSDVLELHDIDKPAIGEGKVLIRIRAAGVNIADWAVMSGLPYIARPVYGLRKPKNAVRGTDVSGVVEAVGAGVTTLRVGDEVFGSADGSFAEFAVASQDEMAPKPSNLTFEQAATVPMAGLVALQALSDVRAGEKILINGASGGIGSFAVQIAKARGAEVTAVCSGRNVDLVRSIGADHVIDYTTDDFTQKPERYDFILDNVSNHSLSDLRQALTPTGTLVPNGGRFDNRWLASGGRLVRGHMMFRFGSKSLKTFITSTTHQGLMALKELIEQGKVAPVMDRTYPLSQAGQALTHVAAGHARGKIAISVSVGVPPLDSSGAVAAMRARPADAPIAVAT